VERVDTVLIPYETRFEIYSINYHQFGLFSPRSNPDRDNECHVVYDKGWWSFTMQVEAGQCSSNQFNTDIDTELKSLQKFLNMT
jgi:hypothetical protein